MLQENHILLESRYTPERAFTCANRTLLRTYWRKLVQALLAEPGLSPPSSLKVTAVVNLSLRIL